MMLVATPATIAAPVEPSAAATAIAPHDNLQDDREPDAECNFARIGEDEINHFENTVHQGRVPTE